MLLPHRALLTPAYTLNMGATATTTGTGDVTGTVRRTTLVQVPPILLEINILLSPSPVWGPYPPL